MFTPKSDKPVYLNPVLKPSELLKYVIYDPVNRTVTRNWSKRSSEVKEVAPGIFRVGSRYFTSEQLMRYIETPESVPKNDKHPDNPALSGNMNGATPPRTRR